MNAVPPRPTGSAPTRLLPTASLFAQLLALIVLSLVGSVAINTLVLVNLPPPMPDFYRVSEIALALKGHPTSSAADRRPLILQTTTTPPLAEPCPPMTLVRECTMISAPEAAGLSKTGVATVWSTINGRP